MVVQEGVTGEFWDSSCGGEVHTFCVCEFGSVISRPLVAMLSLLPFLFFLPFFLFSHRTYTSPSPNRIIPLPQRPIPLQIIPTHVSALSQPHPCRTYSASISFFTNSALLIPLRIASSSARCCWLLNALCRRDRAQS